jgi:paired amphipathic helix protein Sin3a
MYGPPAGQSQGQESVYDYQGQQDQQPSSNAAAIVHQQEQRGVSHLQSAVSATTTGSGRTSMMQLPPGRGQTPGLSQPMNSLTGLGSSVLQGSQADLNKRGPVEFNHAINYVNKIKVSTTLSS